MHVQAPVHFQATGATVACIPAASHSTPAPTPKPPPTPAPHPLPSQVELQLEAQDGSFVETEYGVVGAFGALPSVNGSQPVRLVAAQPLDACAPLAQPLEGAVAITTRGGCSFVAKYLAVLAAGGSAMLMFNDAPGGWWAWRVVTRVLWGGGWVGGRWLADWGQGRGGAAWGAHGELGLEGWR